MVSPASNTEQIVDPVRIFEIVRALFRHGRPGVARQGEQAVRIRAEAFDEQRRTLRWELDGVVADPWIVEWVGYNSVFELSLEAPVTLGDGHVETALPRSIRRVRRRWMRRVMVTSPLRVRFSSPSGPCVAAVRDVSYLGLGFELGPDVLPPVPGAWLDAQVDDAGSTVSIRVEVRSTVPSSSGGHLCGVELVDESDSDDRRWIELVDDQLHPGTHVGGVWQKHLWSLYSQCGYFSLSGKSPEQFEEQRRAFNRVCDQLDDVPHLGCHVVWPRPGGGAAAALSALKVYERAWMGFQMAKITGDIDGVSGRSILREIHQRAYEHMQRDSELAWVLGIPQAKRVWSALVHYDLPKRYVATGEAAIVRFRALEVDCTATRVLLPIEVGVADERERAALARAIARRRPAPYREALDLVPERLDLSRNRGLWQGAGFVREREILVAREHGLAKAAAVLELSSDGMHLFGLLDLARLFPMVEGGEALHPQLVEAARRWFAAHGKTRFVCHLEDEALPADDRVGIVDMGEADLTILAANRLPELLEHLYEVTAPRRG